MCRLTVSNNSKVTPSSFPGNGLFSNLIRALDKCPIEVSEDGMEEWPPFDLPIISTVKLPFSATFIIATFLLTPGIISARRKDPSSNVHSRLTPSLRRYSVTFAAPL